MVKLIVPLLYCGRMLPAETTIMLTPDLERRLIAAGNAENWTPLDADNPNSQPAADLGPTFQNFREMVQDDIKDVFLSLSEFGEIHELDGTPYTMVVDDDQLEQWKSVNLNVTGMSLPENALAGVSIYLFVALEDYPSPEIGQIIRYDGWPLRVVSTKTVNGMLELVLGGASESGRY